jgi:hypothetical protein
LGFSNKNHHFGGLSDSIEKATFTVMNEPVNRRNSERKPFNELLTLELWDSNHPLTMNERIEIKVIDISSGGIGIAAMNTFHVGKVVKIEYVEKDSGVTLPLYSAVVWSRQDDDSTRAGLRFLS